MGVFQRTPLPCGTFQLVAVGYPSATPAARMPRNDGQSTPGRGSGADPPRMPEPSTHTANVTHRRSCFMDMSSPPTSLSEAAPQLIGVLGGEREGGPDS